MSNMTKNDNIIKHLIFKINKDLDKLIFIEKHENKNKLGKSN